MKRRILLAAVITLTLTQAIAQSRSFEILEKKFSVEDEVFSFSLPGFMGRTVLSLAGEKEARQAIRRINHLRVITIPRAAFERRGVTLNGFKKILGRDAFEEAATIRDGDETVSLFVQELKSQNRKRYFILIEEPDEIVAVEIKGYIDVSLFRRTDYLAAKN